MSNYLGITLSKMYWLLGRKSKLSTNNKLLGYKVILKPIWTYGLQLWGSASISNIEELERFQGKVLQKTSVKEEIHRFITKYRDRLYTHRNNLTVHLTVPQDHRRLRRHPPTRFQV
jgi:hypothetical protein